MAINVDDEPDDFESQGPGERGMSTAQRRAAGSSQTQNYATNTQQQPNFFQEAGNVIFGTGQDPGLLGTGQYQPGTGGGRVAIQGAEARSDERAYRQDRVDIRTSPTLNTSRADQFRDQQMALAGDLLAASRGEGPSVAQEQLRQGTEGNLAAAVAAANSVRGAGAAAGAGQLIAGRTNAGQQMASDAALLRANEMTQARGQLGQVLGQGRGMDLDTANANLQAQQETQRQKDVMTLEFMRMGMDEAQAQLQADLEMERLRQAAYEAQAERNQDLFSSLSGAAGSMLGAAACDERVKQDVVRLDTDVIPGVPLARWRYLPSHGDPSRLYEGVIAQDLIRVAPEHVTEGPDGVLRVSSAFAPKEV